VALSQSKIGVAFQSAFGAGATTGTVNHTVTSIPPIGSVAGSQDLEHSKDYAITAGTPLVLDVTALADQQGNAQNFAHVTGILVSNGSTTAGQDLTVGGGSNPLIATWGQPVQANGGWYGFGAPNPGITVSGTVKNIQITVAAGTNVPLTVTVKGRSV
jgi:hypothetical protein